MCYKLHVSILSISCLDSILAGEAVLTDHSDVGAWAHENFDCLDLGDERRNTRVVAIAEMMAKSPGKSIPAMSTGEYEMKAVYRLVGRSEVTPDRLQMTHCSRTKEAMQDTASTFLMLQDTTTVSFTGRAAIADLGPVGDARQGVEGFLMHTALAVRWNDGELDPSCRRRAVEIVGLADQQIFTRTARPAGEKINQKSKRLRRPRESAIWGWATERCARAPQGCDWVRVCDAEADIQPFLVECLEYNHSFVVRACQNRGLTDHVGKLSLDQVREVPSLGSFSISLRARPGIAARTAELNVGSCRLSIRPPFRPGNPGEVLDCMAVRVWEEEAPAGVTPLEWILLTDRPAETFDQARQIARIYSCRWLIEEYHKVLKKGLGVERLQIQHARGLMNTAALFGVVALRLLSLKENSRTEPDLPAGQSGLSPLEIQVMELKLSRKLTTVRDVIMALGKLGGHLGRKCDGMPGWQTLWQGCTSG